MMIAHVVGLIGTDMESWKGKRANEEGKKVGDVGSKVAFYSLNKEKD
jgi:hypothetical protein